MSPDVIAPDAATTRAPNGTTPEAAFPAATPRLTRARAGGPEIVSNPDAGPRVTVVAYGCP